MSSIDSSRAPQLEHIVHYRLIKLVFKQPEAGRIHRFETVEKGSIREHFHAFQNAFENRFFLYDSITCICITCAHDTALTSGTNRHIINFTNAKKTLSNERETGPAIFGFVRDDNKKIAASTAPVILVPGAGDPQGVRQIKTGA